MVLQRNTQVKGMDNLEAINKQNLKNWSKMTNTINAVPKMLQLIWKDDSAKITKGQMKIKPDYIPEEFIIFYSCFYLHPLTRTEKDNKFSGSRGSAALLNKQICKIKFIHLIR